MVHEEQGVRSAAGHLHHPDRRPATAPQVTQFHLHHPASAPQPRPMRVACPESPLKLCELHREAIPTAELRFLPYQDGAHNTQGFRQLADTAVMDDVSRRRACRGALG